MWRLTVRERLVMDEVTQEEERRRKKREILQIRRRREEKEEERDIAKENERKGSEGK